MKNYMKRFLLVIFISDRAQGTGEAMRNYLRGEREKYPVF